MLTVGAVSDKEALAAGRPRPKRPEVMLCSALTGAGVPELLAALDRRAPTPDARLADGASLKRAEAQISGILAQRVNAQLHAPDRAAAREETLRAVAAHELDPFTAADRLLALLGD
jgi:LAO/AO transport system kinase